MYSIYRLPREPFAIHYFSSLSSVSAR
jgi:hypothetical protein